MKISLELLLHTCVALVLWSDSVISGPVQTSTSPAIVLVEITSELEARVANLQERVFARDEDASKRPQFVFPGISNILLGVVTGDLRRIVEDGAFHFLSKGARDQAVSIYRNLIGNRIASRQTTKATTTTSKTTKSTSAVEDPDEVEGEGTDSSAGTEEPEEGDLTTQVTTIRSRFSRRTRRTQAPVTETTARSYAGQEPDEEEEELVSRFEKALRPYLPSNPQDAVVQDYPDIVGHKLDVAA